MGVFERYLTVWVGLGILAGVRLCRPSETVLNILPYPQQGPFIKEDGEVVIDNKGRRV